jgi:thioesterase domain-containing protein
MSKRRRILKRILLGVVVALVALFVIDGLSRLALDDTPHDRFAANSIHPDKGVVFLNGTGTPDTIIDDQWYSFTEEGNFHEIIYSRELFNRQKVIDLVIEKIKPYQHVTFIGASMGGMVAHDVIQELRRTGDTRRFGLILIDSPTGRWSEVALPMPEPLAFLSKAASCLPFGAISNELFSSGRPNGDLSKIHPRNAKRVMELWDEYAAYPWSGRSDQGCYVFYHETLQPLDNVSAVYIRSIQDQFVRDNALEEWGKVVQLPPERVLKVSAQHMSFMDEPDQYNKAFKIAFVLVA